MLVALTAVDSILRITDLQQVRIKQSQEDVTALDLFNCPVSVIR